ncbi:MAG TPA: RNA ligase family protein [Bacilli bacterium]
MKPVIPFEPIRMDTIPLGEQWTYQVKWDGVRILVYYDKGKTQLFNRRLNERTQNYPELLDVKSYCHTDSVILDGEIIALGPEGKPSFHEVMRRDGLRRMERVPQVKKEVSITYLVFDVLFFNGKWIMDWPLKERLALLLKILKPSEHIQLVSCHLKGPDLYTAIQKQDMEGIVCKDLNSTYVIDGKDDRWIKVKNYGDVIAGIGGFTLNGGFVNSVLLGQYDDEGNFYYIGHTGTGRLTKDEWRKLTEILTPDVIKERPFKNKPERHNDAYWVRPKYTVKVKYTEWRWREGRSMRQPSIQAFVDVPPVECKLPHILMTSRRNLFHESILLW